MTIFCILTKLMSKGINHLHEHATEYKEQQQLPTVNNATSGGDSDDSQLANTLKRATSKRKIKRAKLKDRKPNNEEVPADPAEILMGIPDDEHLQHHSSDGPNPWHYHRGPSVDPNCEVELRIVRQQYERRLARLRSALHQVGKSQRNETKKEKYARKLKPRRQVDSEILVLKNQTEKDLVGRFVKNRNFSQPPPPMIKIAGDQVGHELDEVQGAVPDTVSRKYLRWRRRSLRRCRRRTLENCNALERQLMTKPIVMYFLCAALIGMARAMRITVSFYMCPVIDDWRDALRRKLPSHWLRVVGV